MSCFVVEHDTIHRVLTYVDLKLHDRAVSNLAAAAGRAGYRGAKRLTGIGQQMLALNVEAYNTRYREQNGCDEYTFSPRPCSAVQAFASLECWLYQTSDGPCNSPLYLALVEFRNDLARLIVSESPEYQACAWG